LPDDIEYVTVSNYPVATNEPVLAVATPEAAAVSQPITSLPEAAWVVMRQSVGDLIRGESHEQ